MPAEPTTHFVMIETDFAFGFFENRFDGPAHAAEANKLDQGCGSGGIAEVELDFGRIIEVAADDQPDFRARQIIPRLDDAQEGKVTDNRAFAAFFDDGRSPTIFRNRSGQFIDADRAICQVAQTQAGRVSTATFPLRDVHFWSAAPDQGRAFDLSEVPFVQFGHAAWLLF